MRKIKIQLDGGYIDCVRFGNGSSTLVIIPGLSLQSIGSTGTGFMLAWMYRCFSKDYTVYVLDKKNVIPDGYTIKDLADDTVSAMEKLNIGTADIFGVSQGGMIAQYIAVNYPQLVNKLVLGVTASRQNDVMQSAIKNWIKMAEQDDYKAFVTDMFSKMYSEDYIKRYKWMFPVISKFGKPKDFSRFTALARACLTCDVYYELQKIKCPVFVIGGKQDKVLTGQASYEIADKLNCEIYMYEAYGHAAYDEAADFNQRILRFLKS